MSGWVATIGLGVVMAFVTLTVGGVLEYVGAPWWIRLLTGGLVSIITVSLLWLASGFRSEK